MQVLLIGVGAYLATGLVFAIPFAFAGAARMDPAANGATWGFKMLIVPGSAALWPWLLARWMKAGRPS